MKKLLLAIAMVAFGFTANAQDGGFNVGANLGLPTGLGSDVSSFTIGAEANYLFDVSDVFKLGPSVGFLHYFGKDNFNDVSFLPLAGALRFNVSEKIALGGDIGYGVGINDGNEGGFYYRPMFGYNVSDKMMLQATYSTVTSTDGLDNIGNFAVGLMFKL